MTGKDGGYRADDDADDELTQDADFRSWGHGVPHLDTDIILSVECGNTSYKWTAHESAKDDYYACLFWRTSAVSPSDLNGSKELDEVLARYIARPAQEVIFGTAGFCQASDKNKRPRKVDGLTLIQHARRYYALKRIPRLVVFIISTNEEHEHRLARILRGLPVEILRLNGNHFHMEGRYQSLGVDRLAACHGAARHFGVPCLVLDGGTALTYTAVDTKGHIKGGGISPGVQLQFKMLSEGTGALPHIKPLEVKEYFSEASARQEPLPLFASNTRKAIVSSVLHSTTQHIAGVIRRWVTEEKQVSEETAESQAKQAGLKYNKDLSVVITGGDGQLLSELLAPNHSHIIETTSDGQDILPTGTFKPRFEKHMVSESVKSLLMEQKRKLQNRIEKSDVERARQDLLGQRVCKDFATMDPSAENYTPMFFRGTVVAVSQRGKTLEEDLFKIVYDDNDREEVDFTELYDILQRFVKQGEDWDETIPQLGETSPSDERRADDLIYKRHRLNRKREDARNALSLMKKMVPAVDKGAGEVDEPHKNSPVAIEKKRSRDGDTAAGTVEATAKKAKATPVTTPTVEDGSTPSTSSKTKEPNSAKSSAKSASKTGKSWVGKRVAKYFLSADNTEDLFFGTCKIYRPKGHDDNESDEDLWYIIYDDGDEEDLDREDMLNALDLYSQKKGEDKSPINVV